nr:uncharacterized protein At1g04910-like [Ipomoea trifida]
MAVPKSSSGKKKRQSYISVASDIVNSPLQALVLLSPKKQKSPSVSARLRRLLSGLRFWVCFIFLFGFLGTLRLWPSFEPLVPFSPIPCFSLQEKAEVSNGYLGLGGEDNKSGFWKQPDGLGYRPCLDFSEEYKEVSAAGVKDRSKYLVVVVAGGLNQQRNQIVDAVVIARILGAALVVPILQVNVIWGDESEFSDIFDLDHFKKVLADDVRIISSLPSTHVMTRPVEEKRTPLHASPQWIRSHNSKRAEVEDKFSSFLTGIIIRFILLAAEEGWCSVTARWLFFHALRFAPSILELGDKLTERMRSKGPYLALHIRMEKDVWVRTGCLPGLSREYDEMISNERKRRPELLTSRSNMSYHERKLAGLCPLNAFEVSRLLKALGAPRTARIYCAGGIPLGGKEALLPLTTEFPHFYNKEDLALPGELEPFAKKASLMAAIDYIVSEKSDMFMPSHGGNMGHAIQPELRKAGRDVTKYPVHECMCNGTSQHHSSAKKFELISFEVTILKVWRHEMSYDLNFIENMEEDTDDEIQEDE